MRGLALMARGSVRPRKDRPGYYLVRVYLGRDGDGKSRYVGRSVKGKREAERICTELVARHGGHNRADGTITLADWMAEWVDAGRADWSPTTLAGYEATAAHIGRHRIGRKRLVDLRPGDVDAWLRDVRETGVSPDRKKQGEVSAKTVKNCHAALRTALRDAWRQERIPDAGAAMKAKPPKVSRRVVRPPTPQAVNLVVARAGGSKWEAGHEVARAIAILTATGMRRGELSGLRWSDLDAERGVLVVQRGVVRAKDVGLVVKSTKADKARRVVLDPVTLGHLEAQREAVAERARWGGGTLGRDAYVFPDARDTTGRTPSRPDRWTQAWTRQRTAIGLDARLHDLRHLNVSTLLAAGVPVHDVAPRVGHHSGEFTHRAYDWALTDDGDLRAAEVAGRILAPPVSNGPPPSR